MNAAAERTKLCASGHPIRRLGKSLGAERQSLFGSENQPARTRCRDKQALFARKQCRDSGRRLRRYTGFQASLVEIRRIQLDRNAGSREQRTACATPRCEDERIGGKPQRHRS